MVTDVEILVLCSKLNNERRMIMNWFNEMYVKLMNSKWMDTIKSEKGQTIVEYALILVLIAIVVIAMIMGIGRSANRTFSTVNSALQ